MKTWVMRTNSLEETHALGAKIGSLAKENMIFLLQGDLGAGKTTLTQGIAKGLGITKQVTSPTFTIMKMYHGRMPLYHIDAYRLEGLSQDLGFDEYFENGGLTVIEWAQFLSDDIPEENLMIQIHLLEDEKREFSFVANGTIYEELLEELQ